MFAPKHARMRFRVVQLHDRVDEPSHRKSAPDHDVSARKTCHKPEIIFRIAKIIGSIISNLLKELYYLLPQDFVAVH
jgi:hypothetical protein